MRTYCKYFSTLPPTRCHYRKKADISIRPFYVLLLLKMLIHIQPDSNQVAFFFFVKKFLNFIPERSASHSFTKIYPRLSQNGFIRKSNCAVDFIKNPNFYSLRKYGILRTLPRKRRAEYSPKLYR